MCNWTESCREPRLAEIFADPIIRALMASDRVADNEVEALLARIRETEPAARPMSALI